MIQDRVHNLCESLVENIGGVAGIGKKTPPTPIVYLTQWKIVGNSEVHGVGNLTSWKVLGNSVVQDGIIMSCGDLGQDGKYHVKISNGVTIYDIPLDAPLRKVNDVADTIEFPSGTEGKALVTRNLGNVPNIGIYSWKPSADVSTGAVRYTMSADILPNYKQPGTTLANMLCAVYETQLPYSISKGTEGIGMSNTTISIHDDNYNATDSETKAAFKAHLQGVELIYELATPTTELVDVSSFPVSPTDTYTSANVVSFSAFEHTENKEIWSCGEYSAVDGKWHILVQPLGGSIADIALTEPLRKVNDIADTIEFPCDIDGKALVTRPFGSKTLKANSFSVNSSKRFLILNLINAKGEDILTVANILVAGLTTYSYNYLHGHYNEEGLYGACGSTNGYICIADPSFIVDEQKTQVFNDFIEGKEVIYELATPITELVDAPQIQEADSYTMVISQGGKAVSWSSFETE